MMPAYTEGQPLRWARPGGRTELVTFSQWSITVWNTALVFNESGLLTRAHAGALFLQYTALDHDLAEIE